MLLSLVRQPKAGQCRLILGVSGSQHSGQDSSGRVISSLQRPVPDSTQYLEEPGINASAGVLNRNPYKRAILSPSP
jgi:hypothetical protein